MAVMYMARLGEAKEVLYDDEYRLVFSLYSWRITKGGYVLGRRPGHRDVYMHRLVLGLKHGDGLEANHKNWNTLDNRRENLERCTSLENQKKKRPREKKTTAKVAA